MMMKLLSWGTTLAEALLSALAEIILGWFIFGTLATKMLHRGVHGKRRPVMAQNDPPEHKRIHHR